MKFTDEQKFEIALDLISGNLSHSEICRKYDISATYAYKLKDRGLEILRTGINRPPGKPDAEVERLRKHVADLEQLAGDQALVIRILKKKLPRPRIAAQAVRHEGDLSVRRLARAVDEPASTVGRWVKPAAEQEPPRRRHCPVSDDAELRAAVRALCDMPRHRTFGYRRIWALLRREDRWKVNKKTVWRIMHEEGLTRPKVWGRPARPKRVEKMRPTRPNEGWQIDMTSFILTNMVGLYLVTVIDCYTRQIVGWTLHRRCRASEWISALRMALEAADLTTKDACSSLTLRSDNGSQPCSKAFVRYLRKAGVTGQYTGYNAPDDNAYVERVIRTIKEEEIWPNAYDTFSEAHEAIDAFMKYYNADRIHSALGYQTPDEVAAAYRTLDAA